MPTNYVVGPAFASSGGGSGGAQRTAPMGPAPASSTGAQGAAAANPHAGGGATPHPVGGAAVGGNMHPAQPAEPAPIAPGAPKPPNIKAEVNPQLQAVYGATNKYLKDIESGTGHEMDIMGTKMRDAAEGGRQELIDSNAVAGRGGDAGVGAYDAATQRGVQGALSDVAMRRLGLRGQALGELETAARTPEEMAIAEKGLGLQAYNAYNAAVQAQNSAQSASNQTAFNQLLAVLQAQMSAGNVGYGGGAGGGYGSSVTTGDNRYVGPSFAYS